MAITAVLAFSKATATDVFVYEPNVGSPNITMNHLKKITLTKTTMTFYNVDGQTQSYTMPDSFYMRFKRKDFVSGINGVKSLGLSFSFDGTSVNVKGADKVSKAEIISSDGMVLGRITPQSGDFSYNLETLPAGMYIIKLYTAKGSAAEKIIKK